MGKNSDFYKKKTDKYIDKYMELIGMLPRYVYDYSVEVRQYRQPSTLVAYMYDLMAFFEWICAENPLCRNMAPSEVPFDVIKELTSGDILEYKEFLRNTDAHNSIQTTIERRMAPLRGWFDYMVRNEYIAGNPVAGTGMRMRRDKSDIIRLTNRQVSGLKEAVAYSNVQSERSRKFCEKSAERDMALINLFLSTGIRVSECQGLDVDDFDYKEKRITVVRKGGGTSNVYLSDEANTLLLEYCNGWRADVVKKNTDERALFLSNRAQRMCVKAIENVVKKYTASVTGKEYSPHTLRRTFGTSLYDATGDIKLVADTLGHSSVNTTSKHYAATSEAHRRIASRVDLYGGD